MGWRCQADGARVEFGVVHCSNAAYGSDLARDTNTAARFMVVLALGRGLEQRRFVAQDLSRRGYCLHVDR